MPLPLGMVVGRACLEGGLGGVAAEVGGGAAEGKPLPLVKVVLGSGTGLQYSSQRTV